ncbi:BCNT-domain-containing protein [Piedraia hortae CBS 480.64]|uniref:SWR1-complex protein 5 n=1 Tax=Piedraia hortae CBS 480.64 TaxID=1314780 RepID=A0A6A7BYB9_9PEZI|nr:BCNT-domain-containing protein [Piedraia hortae CBS 480.64]
MARYNPEPTGAEEDDADYHEEADEDFVPDTAAASEGTSSSDEDDEEDGGETLAKPGSRKRKPAVDAELESGDEATIKQRAPRRKRVEDEDAEADSGGEGGKGGFVRTRAQRRFDKAQDSKKQQPQKGEVTVDVEKLWKELKSAPLGPLPPPTPALQDEVATPEDFVVIKRRIEYAGVVSEVEERVERDSQLAREHAAREEESAGQKDNRNHLHRPLKRPSMFEPNPTGAVKNVPPTKLRPRAPNRMDVVMAEAQAAEALKKRAEKMTTVQKSALDWKGYVDQQGLRAELDEYGKSKKGFLAREEFLGRADLAREGRRRGGR